MNLKLVLTFCVFLLSSFLQAEPITRLSQEKIKKGEPLYLELEFKGKPSLEVPQKIITKDNVTLEYLGSQDNLSIINGKVSQERKLKFRVLTSKDGKHQTPSFTILENGNPVIIPSKSFEVSKQKYVHEPQNLDDFDSIFDRMLGFQKRRGSSYNPEDSHILFKVSKQRVYVGETFVGYYLFYLRDMNGWFFERNQQTNPEFPFFTSELLPNVNIDAPLTDEYKGITYNLFPYQREVYALTPLRKGKYKIGKTNFLLVDGGIESLFSQKNIEAEPAEVTVIDLPEPKPENFSGEVGSYKISVRASQQQIALGEPWQVELEISGYGIGLLFKDPLTEHCQKMNCKARVSFLGEKRDRKFVKISDGNYAFKTTISFSYSLFPLEEGELQLGTLKINYFNPNNEAYEESSLTFPTLKVLPKPALSQNEVEKETDNLFVPLLMFLLISSTSFLIYNFREDLISLFKTLKIPKVLKLGAVNRDLEILDKIIGNKNGILLKNYLLSKNFDTKLINKILELKSENPNKKMVDIYKVLKKEDKEELSKLIQEQFSKGEKL